MGPFSQYILKFEKLQVDGHGDNTPPPKLPTWKHGEEVGMVFRIQGPHQGWGQTWAMVPADFNNLLSKKWPFQNTPIFFI